MIQISKLTSFEGKKSSVHLLNHKSSLDAPGLSMSEKAFVKRQFANDKNFVVINRYDQVLFIKRIDESKDIYFLLEHCRKCGDRMMEQCNDLLIEELQFVDHTGNIALLMAYVEGTVLASYQFLPHRTQLKSSDINKLKRIYVVGKKIADKEVSQLNIMLEATFMARDLVNEPVIKLNAIALARSFEKMGKEAGFRVEVLKKEKIKALKMGGLLAVNYGSIDPPTFSIMEYKPKNARNKKPYVLIGKGVVFDTGGLSLKPTPNSMDLMKSDMAGAAAVGATLYAIAKSGLPLHVVGLVPATDNRPGGNAVTPGDVITMHDGSTVEVLNTDAEGRLILADALSYAKKYDPALVIDLATLTGSAVAAVGTSGIVCMGTADDKIKDKLKESGRQVYERLAEMPFWDDYEELLKSDIADMKNLGGPYAGSITAGKFLQKFTHYPWIHMDIAGPSFLVSRDGYRGKGGTGVGVRLLFDFFKNS